MCIYWSETEATSQSIVNFLSSEESGTSIQSRKRQGSRTRCSFPKKKRRFSRWGQALQPALEGNIMSGLIDQFSLKCLNMYHIINCTLLKRDFFVDQIRFGFGCASISWNSFFFFSQSVDQSIHFFPWDIPDIKLKSFTNQLVSL